MCAMLSWKNSWNIGEECIVSERLNTIVCVSACIRVQ